LSRLPELGETLDDPTDVFDRFLDYVTEIGLELYDAQEEALLEIVADNNVILATPTGSGKSLVALAMHFKAMCEDKRSFYTSPVKALVNEKFFDLCEAFHPDNVGLMTGDATVNRDAPIICCTAEILANMALREGALADVQYAVLDEFHFYGDRDRGVAWQIPLLCLPQTRFLLMSATLGDMSSFEEALTELNGRPTATVTSDQRPVPLSYHYLVSPLHEVVPWLIDKDEAPVYLVNFTQKSCHDEAQSLMSVDFTPKEDKRAISAMLKDFRFDTPYGKKIQRFIRHGIGVHHGGMLPKYRRLVERLAKEGLLKVISGTDTLGVGVNIPIRTVVFSKLCKFDGQKTRLLRVRDFKQICGRAGRKGYDDHGSVVALAPAHVIENERAKAKAAGDPKKLKKLHKKKPPERGYVHWNEQTFNKLKKGRPEPLKSRFAVSHGMILSVLSRPEGGCQAMKDLIRNSHDRKAVKHRHAKVAIQMFRSLVEADVVALVDQPDRIAKKAVVNVDLQDEFSLNYGLSLFVVQALEVLDREIETYPLDVLSLVEAILEDPHIILRKQLDRIKTEALVEMKAAGMDYEDRMEELDKLEHPKPNAELIYGLFDAYAGGQPWLGRENVHPKGVGRELYERALDMRSYIVDMKLERSEGTVLRYFTDVYKALVQTVPNWAVTPEVEDMIEFFGAVVRGVDASLITEWERLRDPDYVPTRFEPEPVLESRGVTGDRRAFTVLVRNAAFRVVRALARRAFDEAAELVESPEDAEPWTAERLESALERYFEEHGAIRIDPRARATEFCVIEEQDDHWRVRQVLLDPDEHGEWFLGLRVDLEASDEADAPVLVLETIRD
jgi:superfamily II RNA helicase